MTGKSDIAPWKVLESELLFEAPRFNVFRDKVLTPEGQIIDDYHQIEMGGAAVVAATDPDGRFLVQRLYKHGARRVGLGFPGGGVEEHETALEAGRRELLEETGFAAEDWRCLGEYAVHSNQGAGMVSFFSARNAIAVQEPIGGDLERHELLFVSRQALRDAIDQQKFLSMGHVCLAGLVLLADDCNSSAEA